MEFPRFLEVEQVLKEHLIVSEAWINHIAIDRTEFITKTDGERIHIIGFQFSSPEKNFFECRLSLGKI